MENEKKVGWWSRLKQGLKKSSDRLGDGLKTIFVRRKLDQTMLDELEELLISTDMGVSTAAHLTQTLSKQRLDKDVSVEEVKEILATAICDILNPLAMPLTIDPSHHPYIILVVGVNGAGKTTTIGKLAKFWQDQGHKVHLAAGDTFRAAAVEQLQVWGGRLNISVTTGPENGDAAALVYDAIAQAQQNNADILLIDTAGRLHNKTHLMEELKKIVRVIQKTDATAPHATLLVLDATTGQNAHQQVKIFKEMVGVNGLVMTKLDGTARGGVVVALAQTYNLPIYALGVGEAVDDLKPFTAADFALTLVGMPTES